LIEEAPILSFCKEHGVHGCVLCNPSLAETKQPTGPTPRDLQRAQRALNLRPRSENLAIGGSSGTRVQFASLAAMKKAGVDVEPVERRQIVESISAAAEIRYDATKTALVSPQADGIVRRVMVEVGTWVKRGQILAVIDSKEIGRLTTELLAALADERLQRSTVSRLRPIAGQAIAGKRLLESENDLQQASAEVDRAAGALGNLGIQVDLARLRGLSAGAADAYVRALGLSGLPSDALSLGAHNKNLVAVIAPLEGQIVERTATIGQVVDRGSELFRLVDTRSVWLDLRAAAEEASYIRLGQDVFFLPDGQSQRHAGNITWISTDVDARTRTVRVRAELANVDQDLRNESFGRGQIILRDEPRAIVVPESAVQWDGTGQIVFVRDTRFFEEGRAKFFVARSVRTGVTHDGFVEIIAGTLPGEVVATDGSEVLKAQLLRSNLGAGCTCGH
jgi:multidrug efflux pump subunit AcrA (membrane-fusion protein)